jgi:hypothetical protein
LGHCTSNPPIHTGYSMRTEDRYIEVVSGNVCEEISVNLGRKKVLLRPIFIENDDGERDVMCYVPQDLQPRKMSRSLRWSATFCVRECKKHSRIERVSVVTSENLDATRNKLPPLVVSDNKCRHREGDEERTKKPNFHRYVSQGVKGTKSFSWSLRGIQVNFRTHIID